MFGANITETYGVKPIVDIDALKENLPSGSGIDTSWDITVHSNGNVTASASYHCMNECGMYDGWEDFSFRVFKAKADKLNPLIGPCEGKVQVIHRKGDICWSGVRISERRASAFGLRDYLTDVCYDAVKDFLTKRNEVIDKEAA